MDMNMVKDGLNQMRAGILGGVALVMILASRTWVPSVKALPFEGDVVAAAGVDTGAQKSPAKKAVPAKRKTSAKRAAKAETSAKTSEESAATGKRDPFKLPPPPVPGGEEIQQISGPLPPGPRGLVISQLRVEGIVRLDTNNTMIAVVDNSRNRAYFLRENDAVYNGVVSKITPDSVIFRENALDRNGKVQVREVVKRLGQGPGA
jgi:type II secretory pathway component PulC